MVSAVSTQKEKDAEIKAFYKTISDYSFRHFEGDVILDIETTGLKSFENRLVTIGVKNADFEKVFYNDDEAELLKEFWEFCESNKIRRFVGWNVHWDCAFLRVRSAIKYKINVPSFSFLDMRYIIGYGDRYYPGKMPIVEECMGLVDENKLAPGFDGGDVPTLFDAGQIDEIIDHNIDDLRSEYLVYQRLVLSGVLYER